MSGPVPPIDVQPATLTGVTVTLEPLDDAHRSGLFEAAQDEWYGKALSLQASGGALVFAVRLNEDGRLVGSTRYLNISAIDRRLEIGSTWYNPSVWAGKVNPECKLLLMTHAFETLGCYRVEYRCDSRNRRSRAAILKLGAKEEGTMRRHQRTRGDFWRDTLQFAILDSEWPAVKAGLQARLT
jgi:RimJ/RimL family protein N-acetyltransferase